MTKPNMYSPSETDVSAAVKYTCLRSKHASIDHAVGVSTQLMQQQQTPRMAHIFSTLVWFSFILAAAVIKRNKSNTEI